MGSVACPGDDALATYSDGAGSAAERATLERHTLECATCRELLSVMSATYEKEEIGSAKPASESVAAGAPARAITIGRYELVVQLGRGGTGVVHEARDPVLGRRVAVKLLLGEVSETGEGEQARLLREARAMARVSHPNVVTVYDAGVEDGRVFLTMELVRGPSLREHLKEHPKLEVEERLALFRGAARGLFAAHEADVVHRDFKPDNVLLGSSGPCVTDFGLARPSAPGAGFSDAAPTSNDARWLSNGATRGIHGTPSYMSPEQIDGRPVIDARTDQFSFAVALYEALFEAHPFGLGRTDGPKAIRALRQRMDEGPLAPPPLAPAWDWLWPVIARALRVAPEERFPDMATFARALDGPAPERDGTHLLRLLSMSVGLMCGVHLTVLVIMLVALGTPAEPDPGPDSIAQTIAGVVLVLWGGVGGVLAPLSGVGLWRRRRWALATTLAYAIVSLPTGLGTPFSLFAFYALSRRSLRASLDSRSRA